MQFNLIIIKAIRLAIVYMARLSYIYMYIFSAFIIDILELTLE